MAKTKVSKDYKQIIEVLKKVKVSSKEDTKALNEAIDIISDYERAIEQTNRLTQMYEIGAPIVFKNISGILAYICPNCGSTIQWATARHCYNCGKKFSLTLKRGAR